MAITVGSQIQDIQVSQTWPGRMIPHLLDVHPLKIFYRRIFDVNWAKKTSFSSPRISQNSYWLKNCMFSLFLFLYPELGRFSWLNKHIFMAFLDLLSYRSLNMFQNYWNPKIPHPRLKVQVFVQNRGGRKTPVVLSHLPGSFAAILKQTKCNHFIQACWYPANGLSAFYWNEQLWETQWHKTIIRRWCLQSIYGNIGDYL